MKICPTCGARTSADDTYCEADGSLLRTEAAAPGGLCPCGAAQDDGEGYCSVCGHKIQIPAPGDHVESDLGPDCAAVSDRGRRHPRNEDAQALTRDGPEGNRLAALVVCDGVSTTIAPDLAAATAVTTARDALLAAATAGKVGFEDAMRAAILAAHDAVCAGAPAPEGELDPSGATIVAALVRGGAVTLGWVGDSRAYWIGAGAARRLTRDDSWAEEQIASGALSEEEAYANPLAHAITHCIGPCETVETGVPPQPNVLQFAVPEPGWLLLCSDGLWNYAAEPEALRELLSPDTAPEDALARARRLVDFALQQGGRDNITVALLRLAPEATAEVAPAEAGADVPEAEEERNSAANTVV